jgi:histone H3/H4
MARRKAAKAAEAAPAPEPVEEVEVEAGESAPQAYQYWSAGVDKIKAAVCPSVKVKKRGDRRTAGPSDTVHNIALATACRIASAADRLQMGHQTLSFADVTNSVESVVGPLSALAEGMVAAAAGAVEKFNATPAGTGGARRQKSDRAGILLGVGPAKVIIQEAGIARASDEARIALAAACGHLVGRLWAAAAAPEVAAAMGGRTMLTLRHLLLGVDAEADLAAFFRRAGYRIGGAGAVPYMNPELTDGQPAIRKNRKGRYPSGAAARKAVKFYQASADPLTALAPYKRQIDDVLGGATGGGPDAPPKISVSEDARVAIRQAAEQAAVEVGRAAQDTDCAGGAGRKSLTAATWMATAAMLYPDVGLPPADPEALQAQLSDRAPCVEGVKKLLRRAGVIRAPKSVYPVVQHFVLSFVELLVAHANICRRSEKKRVTLMFRDVVVGARELGQVWLDYVPPPKNVYGLNIYRIA